MPYSFMQTRQRHSGFTIVELLIVIVVIAILATIVIIGYTNAARSAEIATLHSDLRSVSKKVLEHKVGHNALPTSLANIGIVDGIISYTYLPSDQEFCLSAVRTEKPDLSYKIGTNGTIEEGSCTVTWTDIFTGYYSSFGLTSNNKIYAWGYDMPNGPLTNPAGTPQSSPVEITNRGALAGQKIVQIFPMGNVTLAMSSDKKIFGWGTPNAHQLGLGSTAARTLPIEIANNGSLTGKQVETIAVGGSHVIVLATDGTVHGWGANQAGQVGTGTTSNWQTTPIEITHSGALAGRQIVNIQTNSGASHTYALDTEGKVYGWGEAITNKLSTVDTSHKPTPFSLSESSPLGTKTIREVKAGRNASIAIATDGSLFAWGAAGSVGDGTNVNKHTPTEISQSGSLAGKTITSFDLWENYVFALSEDGVLHGWGINTNGVLGVGASTQVRSRPIVVASGGVLAGKSITKFVSGRQHAFAFASDGTIGAWGLNERGQLGIGSTTAQRTPVAFPAPPQN